jgi:hypothetical protein
MDCDHCGRFLRSSNNAPTELFWCADCYHREGIDLLKEVGFTPPCTLEGCEEIASLSGIVNAEMKQRIRAIPKVVRCSQCDKIHP